MPKFTWGTWEMRSMQTQFIGEGEGASTQSFSDIDHNFAAAPLYNANAIDIDVKVFSHLGEET